MLFILCRHSEGWLGTRSWNSEVCLVYVQEIIGGSVQLLYPQSVLQIRIHQRYMTNVKLISRNIFQIKKRKNISNLKPYCGQEIRP